MAESKQEVEQIERRVLRGARQALTVSSTAFGSGREIPREFAAAGDDASPPLAWENVPEETQALALVVDDPDAPSGLFTHWTAWNLPPAQRNLPREASRTTLKSIGAVEGKNDFGASGWNGPDPPSGTHRYFFRVFALRAPLDLPDDAPPADVWRALEGNVLAWGETMGTFTKR